jgi:hypothetical protein
MQSELLVKMHCIGHCIRFDIPPKGKKKDNPGDSIVLMTPASNATERFAGKT